MNVALKGTAFRPSDSTGKGLSPLGKFPASPRFGLGTGPFSPPWNPFPTFRPESFSIHRNQPSHRDKSLQSTRTTWCLGEDGLSRGSERTLELNQNIFNQVW